MDTPRHRVPGTDIDSVVVTPGIVSLDSVVDLVTDPAIPSRDFGNNSEPFSVVSGPAVFGADLKKAVRGFVPFAAEELTPDTGARLNVCR